MNREKILSAITSAIGYLENSLKLFSNRDEEETFNMVWRASSDVEYCLFLLALLHSNEVESFHLKHRSSSKQMEMQPALTSALDILKEARSDVENCDFVKAHEKAWQARSYLLKVQEIFEKKRKIGAERSSTTRFS
jgi:hypothetical protein